MPSFQQVSFIPEMLGNGMTHHDILLPQTLKHFRRQWQLHEAIESIFHSEKIVERLGQRVWRIRDQKVRSLRLQEHNGSAKRQPHGD